MVLIIILLLIVSLLHRTEIFLWQKYNEKIWGGNLGGLNILESPYYSKAQWPWKSYNNEFIPEEVRASIDKKFSQLTVFIENDIQSYNTYSV